MPPLRSWKELAAGGAVRPDAALRPRTGSWRTGVKPDVDRAACVNCLLCWLYCPDSAVVVDGDVFVGFDLDYCKGCELCAELCPTDAIRMVPEADGGV